MGAASSPGSRRSWKAAQYGWKHALAIGWATTCVVVALVSSWQLEPHAASFAFLYFSPLSAPLLFVWLWASAVQHFEQRQISYETPFSAAERKFLLAPQHIVEVATVLTLVALTGAAAFAWSCAQQYFVVAQHIPSTVYILMVLCLMFPGNMLHRSTRTFFCRTVFRVLLPFQEMTWADFLLADILTSLAKPLADMERASCTIMTGPPLRQLTHPHYNADEVCGPLSWHALATLCLPYTIRFAQCIRVWATAGDAKQAFNALKYASAFPALVLSAVEHEYHIRSIPYDMTLLWLLAACFNSLFSFYWDVEQDWDMPWLVQAGRGGGWQLLLPAPKPDSYYSPGWYNWLLVSNLALRHAWSHRLVGRLEAHDAVTWAVTLLEAFRRYQWVFGRYETELRKLHVKHTHGGSEKEALLGGQDAVHDVRA